MTTFALHHTRCEQCLNMMLNIFVSYVLLIICVPTSFLHKFLCLMCEDVAISVRHVVLPFSLNMHCRQTVMPTECRNIGYGLV